MSLENSFENPSLVQKSMFYDSPNIWILYIKVDIG